MENKSQKILIVDDEQGIRDQLSLALEDEYTLSEAGSARDALAAVTEQRPDVVLLDISLSPYSDSQEGLEILPQMLEVDAFLKIIMVTGNGEKENALTAVQQGAFDFYVKPIDLTELGIIIKRAMYLRSLELENAHLSSKLADRGSFPEIIGESSQMRKVFKIVETVAETSYTVLITGESGTGKELIAKALHRRSERAEAPFVTINCGAIPETLLESELFGHEKGAFTDAVSQKLGRFELANKGTLFLDEVGELSLALQVKLLRFLQDKIIERVGGKEGIQVDVRVIAATNRSLSEEVENRSFREDLYYRLSVINIELPPLRDREDDVILIATHLLRAYADENNKSNLKFSPSAMTALRQYDWPGNIRELENRLKRAVIFSDGSRLSASDLGFDEKTGGERKTLQEVRELAESKHIAAALQRSNYNVSKAARERRPSRTTLYDLLDKYKISKDR